MRNIFFRLFPGSLSVPYAYGITIMSTLIVIALLSVLNITNIVVTRSCDTYLQLDGRILPGLALPTVTVFP